MKAKRADIRRAKQEMLKTRLWPRASIATDELELRPYTAYDIEPFVRSIDDEVRYWQGLDQRTIDIYVTSLQFLVRWPHRAFPHRYLALVRDGRFAGGYQMRPSVGRRDRWDVELGWWLAPEARGQGLGRASLAVALVHVHRDLGLRVAQMGTEVHNVRAVRQIEAVGATPLEEGRHTLPNGRVIDARWYHHVATEADWSGWV